MVKEKIELTLQDESGQEYVAYPFVESEDVTLSNGMDIETMIAQDVSMPIVTHEETSFKVGVGDSDISNSIVDSSVANMTIKGQTYQNILPDPTLRNNMTDGKTMQKLNEGYESVNTVDGVCKSAILSGQTLVNLVAYDKTNLSTSIWNHFVQFSDLKYDLKSSTKYLLIFNITNYNVDGTFTIRLDDKAKHTYFKGQEITINGNGVYKIIRETKDDLLNISSVLFTAHNPETTSGTYDMKIMIIEYQEGMENWNIPYFEGMQSVKMPVLTTIGRNVLNPKRFVSTINTSSNDGVVININNQIEDLNFRSLYDELTLPVDTYTITCEVVNGTYLGGNLCIFDENNKNIREFAFKNGSGSTTITSSINKLRLWNAYGTDNCQIRVTITKDGSTSYEPYKSNILSTPEEVVLRSLPNGVKDTLNLNTGEYVQRIGEVVFNGSETWSLNYEENSDLLTFSLNKFPSNIVEHMFNNSSQYLLSDSLPVTVDYKNNRGILSHRLGGNHWIVITVKRNELTSQDVVGFKQFLSTNPVTIQYQLATESIKTVDLSSSGNWEKIVLDGSGDEDWQLDTTKTITQVFRLKLSDTRDDKLANKCFSDKLPKNNGDGSDTEKIETTNKNGLGHWLYIALNKTKASNVSELKVYLSQNPITVWYQTTTHQESTNVKEMLSFSNGHVQLSSAEGSLIPSLSYEAPTSNSYQLDLAKTNTKYTMKSSSANGNFTIDGTQYNFNTNGTFTTPSTMNNKLMIANGTVTDLMFIEGDVTSKTIPYFKGIKSAFEDEDKIEVLSTGKNLLNHNHIKTSSEFGMTLSVVGNKLKLTGTPIRSYGIHNISKKLKKGSKYYFYVTVDGVKRNDIGFRLWGYEGSNLVINVANGGSVLLSKDVDVCLVWENLTVGETKTFENIEVMIEQSSESTSYEPYKQNITKIPLLSPLRSLPNGVKDEVILDRENHKAKIIQRVGKVVLNGSEVISLDYPHAYNDTIAFKVGNTSLPNKDNGGIISDTLKGVDGDGYWLKDEENIMTANLNNFKGRILRSKLTLQNAEGVKRHLQQNPLTVYYELATPVITEVDLEGFPYIYKDGHIFINSEIAPTSEITYSINQQHQIEASNEDLMRHEKKITNLHKLIGTYVNVEYESTLLALNLELK